MKTHLLFLLSVLLSAISNCYGQEVYPPYDTSAIFWYDLSTPSLDSILSNAFHYELDENDHRKKTLELANLPALTNEDSVSKTYHFPGPTGADTSYLREIKIESIWQLSSEGRMTFHPNGNLKSSEILDYSSDPPYSLFRKSVNQTDLLGNTFQFKLENNGTGFDTVYKYSVVLTGNVEETSTFTWNNNTNQLAPYKKYVRVRAQDGRIISETFSFAFSDSILTLLDSTSYLYDNQFRMTAIEQHIWDNLAKEWNLNSQTLIDYPLNPDTVSVRNQFFLTFGVWKPSSRRITLTPDTLQLESHKSFNYRWKDSAFHFSMKTLVKVDENGRYKSEQYIIDQGLDSTTFFYTTIEVSYFGSSDIIRSRIIWDKQNSDPFQKSQAYYYSLADGINLGVEPHIPYTWQLYPNPASSEIFVKLPDPQPAFIDIFDPSGSLVKTQVLRNQQQSISISDFTPGIYLIKIRQGENIEAKKLVVH